MLSSSSSTSFVCYNNKATRRNNNNAMLFLITLPLLLPHSRCKLLLRWQTRRAQKFFRLGKREEMPPPRAYILMQIALKDNDAALL